MGSQTPPLELELELTELDTDEELTLLDTEDEVTLDELATLDDAMLELLATELTAVELLDATLLDVTLPPDEELAAVVLEDETAVEPAAVEAELAFVVAAPWQTPMTQLSPAAQPFPQAPQ